MGILGALKQLFGADAPRAEMSKGETNGMPEVAAPFTRAEYGYLADFLQAGSDEFADHSANDWTCPPTEENKGILRSALDFNVALRSASDFHIAFRNAPIDPQFAEIRDKNECAREDEELFLWDYWLMAYFAHRCRQVAAMPDPLVTPSAAEFKFIGELLDGVAMERKSQDKAGVPTNFKLIATPENKVLIASAIERFGEKQIKQLAKSALEATGEVEGPEYCVAEYYASHCLNLSRQKGK
jgi:hypothetical protein